MTRFLMMSESVFVDKEKTNYEPVSIRPIHILPLVERVKQEKFTLPQIPDVSIGNDELFGCFSIRQK